MCHFFHAQIRAASENLSPTAPSRTPSLLTCQPATGNCKSGCFPGPRGSPCGQLSVSWDSREMTRCSKMGNITPAPRVVTGLQGASFVLYLADRGLGTNSGLTTQGKRLNHTLLSSRVCGMCEVSLFPFFPFFKKFIFITVFTSERCLISLASLGFQHREEKS